MTEVSTASSRAAVAVKQRSYPGRVGAGGEHGVDDLLPWVHGVPARDLVQHRRAEAPPTEPGHPAQIAVLGAGKGDGQRRVPGGGLKRLAGGA